MDLDAGWTFKNKRRRRRRTIQFHKYATKFKTHGSKLYFTRDELKPHRKVFFIMFKTTAYF